MELWKPELRVEAGELLDVLELDVERVELLFEDTWIILPNL